MEFENYKIMIFTRSMNYILYKASSNTITLPFPRKRLTYTTAEGYLYEILKYDIDFAINIDEDAFVIDNSALLDLLRYVIKNDYVNCGVRDGGALSIRNGNPIVTNPFFNILNVKKIRQSFTIDIVKEYVKNKVDYSHYIPTNLMFEFNVTDDYEPFYPFFIWLNTSYKTLYLDARQDNDGYTTVVYNHNNKIVLYHSWYSRMFGVDQFHTKRILNLYNKCTTKSLIFSIREKIIILFEKFLNEKVIPQVLPIRRYVLSKIKKND